MDNWNVRSITETITWIGFFSAIFFAYYYYLRFRNKERMLLIERNVDLSEIYKTPERHFPWLMVGFTLLGIGLGMVLSFSVAYIVSQTRQIDRAQVSIIFLSASVLFGAIGIITGHSLEQKKKKLRG